MLDLQSKNQTYISFYPILLTGNIIQNYALYNFFEQSATHNTHCNLLCQTCAVVLFLIKHLFAYPYSLRQCDLLFILERINSMTVKWLANIVRRGIRTWHVWPMNVDSAIANSSTFATRIHCSNLRPGKMFSGSGVLCLFYVFFLKLILFMFYSSTSSSENYSRYFENEIRFVDTWLGDETLNCGQRYWMNLILTRGLWLIRYV